MANLHSKSISSNIYFTSSKIQKINKFPIRKPFYHDSLNKKANPIFMTVNFGIAQYIRGCGGNCLLCSKNPVAYDFRFANHKEFWILYTCVCELSATKKLGELLIKNGAHKVEIKPLKHLLDIQEDYYE